MTPPPKDPLRADFRNFLYVVWKHLRLPPPTPIQYAIAYLLQHGPRRLVLQAFRGVGKSWITSAYVCWLLYCAPDIKVLVVSGSKDRADAFSTFTKRLIAEMDILAHLRPRPGQRDSNVAFEVGPAKAAHAPSVKSVGITGQLTGTRANVIIADDIESANNSLTQLMRDRLAEAVKEFEAILSPGGTILFLGTPQSEMSIYNVLPERGYTTFIYPARFPTPAQLGRYGDRLGSYITEQLETNPALAGTSTEPGRFPEMDLLEREASYGRSGFALQFMLDTTLADGNRYPLKLSDLMVMGLNPVMAPTKVAWASSPDLVLNTLPVVGLAGDRYYRPAFIDKEWAPFQGAVMAIDPSGRGADELGYAVVKHLNGVLYATVVGGLHGGYSPENLTLLAKIAKDQAVNLVLIEDNFGDGMFTALFRPVLSKHYVCTIEEVHSTGQKERRIIDTLEPVLNQHRLVIDEKVVRADFQPDRAQYQLLYQLTRITKDRQSLRHDDRLEALAIATKHWVGRLAQSVDDAAARQREQALQAELNKFMEGVLGRRPTGPMWVNPFE